MPLVEQELLTFWEHPSSPPVFSGVRINRSLVLYVCFVDRCLSFCTFSFGHCVVCPSSIYGFWLPLWHLQTLLEDATGVMRIRQQHSLTKNPEWTQVLRKTNQFLLHYAHPSCHSSYNPGERNSTQNKKI